MSIGWHLEYWQDLAEGKLDAYGYIKVIQYLKTLENGFLCWYSVVV